MTKINLKMENKLTHQESWNIMQDMISNTKKSLKDDGSYYLLWGWLSLIANLGHWIGIQLGKPELAPIVWPVLMISGGVYSAIKSSRESKNQSVKTHLGNIMAMVWMGFGLSMVIAFVAVASQKNWLLINPMVIMLYAWGTFISGAILKFKPLIYGGVFAWVLAGFSFFAPQDIQLIIGAVAIIVSYLIPGYILKSKN